MKKVLMLVDHYPLSPRALKMRKTIITNDNVEVKIFVWNRRSLKINEEFVEGFNSKTGYGNFFRTLMDLPRYLYNSKKFIEKYQPDIIHAVDYTSLNATPIKSEYTKIIYEIYDIKFFNNAIVNKYREYKETKLINERVDSIIIASPFFEEYYKSKLFIDREYLVINNMPSEKITSSQRVYIPIEHNKEKLKDKIIISFIGRVRYKEILLNLLNAIQSKNNIILLIAGDGPDLNDIKKYINDNDMIDKVIVTGSFEESDLTNIYSYTDFVWAAYPNKDTNVYYAISNKYFESIVFKKPIIVSQGTKLGEYVSENNTGMIVNPYSVNDIEKLLDDLGKVDIMPSSNEVIFWESEENRVIKLYNRLLKDIN